MAERWEKQIGALYRLDPDEFVAARNELAKEVRGEDRKAATAIRNLAKPTIVAWAVNQVALAQPKLVASVLAATANLQAAQDKAVGGERAALKAATDKRRKAVAAVVDAAVAALSKAGRAGESHREAIRKTVEAASLEEDAGALLQAGRLEHELDAPATFGGLDGFGGFAGSDVEAADPAPVPQRALDPEEIEREARRARAEAEDLAELAATARERAQEAAQQCRDARAAVDAAEAQLKDAKRDLERAMDAAKTTSMRAAEIERKAEDAKARAAELGAAAAR